MSLVGRRAGFGSGSAFGSALGSDSARLSSTLQRLLSRTAAREGQHASLSARAQSASASRAQCEARGMRGVRCFVLRPGNVARPAWLEAEARLASRPGRQRLESSQLSGCQGQGRPNLP